MGGLVQSFCIFILCPIFLSGPGGCSLRSSPLDGGQEYKIEEPTFWSNGKVYDANMPSCESACSEVQGKILSILFAPGNIQESMRAACKYYAEAVECLRPLTHCPRSMFDTLTSGVRYMCEEQKEAFDVLIGCIDTNSFIVQSDCDLMCQPKTLLTGLALKDTFMRSLDRSISTPKINLNMRELIEPHLGKIFFSEGCRVTQCLMNCYKTKFNMLCEGTAGSIMMEMLARPLEVDSVPKSYPQFLSTFVNGLLPHTCSFLYSKHGGLRIDAELDKEIKRMYNHRRSTTAADIAASVGGPASDSSPFLLLENAFLRSSPIDRDAQNLIIEKVTESLAGPEESVPELNRDSFLSENTSSVADLTDARDSQDSSGISPDYFGSGGGSSSTSIPLSLSDELTVESGKMYLIELDVNPAETGDTIICEIEEDLYGSGSGFSPIF